MGLLDKMVKAVLGSTTSDAGALTASQVNLLRQAMEPLGTLSAPRVAERAQALAEAGDVHGVPAVRPSLRIVPRWIVTNSKTWLRSPITTWVL